MVRAIGPKNAEVIDFYVDSRVATEGSGQYEAAMRKLLGEHGGNLVIEAIESELAKLGHHGTKDGVRGLSRGNKRVSPEA